MRLSVMTWMRTSMTKLIAFKSEKWRMGLASKSGCFGIVYEHDEQ